MAVSEERQLENGYWWNGVYIYDIIFFFSSRRRHTRCSRDWSSDVCSSDLYGRTKPGYLLKHHIPVKTDRWDVQTPGFTEADLVSHSGHSASGEFAHTLNVNRHADHLDGVDGGAGTRGRARTTGVKRDRHGVALSAVGCGHGLWQRVHQLPFEALVRHTADPVHAGTAVQKGRQRAHRAKELDASAQAAGLGPPRHPRGRGGHERSLPHRTAAVDELVPSFGEVAEESTRSRVS